MVAISSSSLFASFVVLAGLVSASPILSKRDNAICSTVVGNDDIDRLEALSDFCNAWTPACTDTISAACPDKDADAATIANVCDFYPGSTTLAHAECMGTCSGNLADHVNYTPQVVTNSNITTTDCTV